MSFEIYVCTGCGQQIAETYEYKHDDHDGEEVLTEVFSQEEIVERLEAAADERLGSYGKAVAQALLLAAFPDKETEE